MTWRVCNVPGCGAWVGTGARCPTHATRRPSASQRGYGAKWRRRRAAFLRSNSICVDCGGPATVADHDPVTRGELVRRGDFDPDAVWHLKPRCAVCHNRRTAATSPGGWAV